MIYSEHCTIMVVDVPHLILDTFNDAIQFK